MAKKQDGAGVIVLVPYDARWPNDFARVDDMGCYSEGKTSFIRDVERRAAIWRSAGCDD